MASPTPKSKKRHPQPSTQPEVVSPIWLLKALAFTLLVALLCAYATFCFLFHQGQWQLVLHPVRTSASPQSIAGNLYELVHFGPDESALPQLTGWWIPSAPNGRYSQTTLLFLPGANGSLADSIPTLATLHNLGINIFAFDYRGYGQSAATHPSQQNMTHDAEAAWQYLTTSRHIPAQQIIPYGTGIGASLATHLATTHPSTPAIILDSPISEFEILDRVLEDPRTHLLPTRLLFHEKFEISQPLSTLKTPKLFLLLNEPSKDLKDAEADLRSDAVEDMVDGAAPPKIIANLHSADFNSPIYGEQLRRFLDQYLPAPVPQLVPTPAPSTQNPH